MRQTSSSSSFGIREDRRDDFVGIGRLPTLGSHPHRITGNSRYLHQCRESKEMIERTKLVVENIVENTGNSFIRYLSREMRRKVGFHFPEQMTSTWGARFGKLLLRRRRRRRQSARSEHPIGPGEGGREEKRRALPNKRRINRREGRRGPQASTEVDSHFTGIKKHIQ